MNQKKPAQGRVAVLTARQQVAQRGRKRKSKHKAQKVKVHRPSPRSGRKIVAHGVSRG